MRKRKNKKSEDYLNLPRLEINHQAQKSILVVLVFVFSLLAFLSLFNLSGQFGQFLDRWLSLIFGFGKWLVPLIFFFWGVLLASNKIISLKISDYLGLFFLFISYQTLFHFFLPTVDKLSLIEEGVGGGYIGYYLDQAFLYVLGFWGGLIVLIGLSLISLVLVFDTSLTALIGKESFLGRFFKWFIKTWSQLFTFKNKGNKELENDALRTAAEDQLSQEEDILNTWQQRNLIDPNSEDDESLRGADETEFREEVVKTPVAKVQEKIAWPKRKIKIDLPIELLNNKFSKAIGGNTENNAAKIKHTLENFGINVEMGETKVGPTVTQYTFKPAEGVKLSRITTLNNDLSLALAAHPIRIEAPIPGKSLVGVEVPNAAKAIVGLREILEDDVFKKRKHNMMIAVGKDVAGTSWIYDLTRMPHLLVAGATNSGKSVCLNTIIISLLYQNSPDTLRFIMVDPKRVELPAYNGIPHLLTPVVTEVSKTINALKWCLNEMDHRYDLLNRSSCKNIQSYNQKAKENLPYIVFIIDELADFMMTAGKEMEAAVIRLAQMSRAVGIHLILATQRPSVDVITGLIKANIPARIAFSVTSLVDSKTILDMSGAEKLLGQGDMLLTTAELSKPKRIQGAFVSDDEINDIINYIKEKGGEAEYLEGVTDRQKVSGVAGVGLDGTHGDEDELLVEARDIILKANKASTSLLQRRLSIGYGRAAKILDMLEQAGIIGPANGSRPREILISSEEQASLIGQSISGLSLHNRQEFSAPQNYLSGKDEDSVSDEDDVLVFEDNQIVEAEDDKPTADDFDPEELADFEELDDGKLNSEDDNFTLKEKNSMMVDDQSETDKLVTKNNQPLTNANSSANQKDAMNQDTDQNIPDFFLDDDGPEDEVKTGGQIVSEIRPSEISAEPSVTNEGASKVKDNTEDDIEDDTKVDPEDDIEDDNDDQKIKTDSRSTSKTDNQVSGTPKPRVFSDDEDGMFFSR